jgi:hypothetical protein
MSLLLIFFDGKQSAISASRVSITKQHKIMKDAYFLSRAYVEFGPFPAAEMLGFFDRGLLRETDYILGEGTESTWLHLPEWVTLHRAPAKAVEPKAVKKASVKAALAKPPPVKKAVKKTK